jgi:hypothetical protein
MYSFTDCEEVTTYYPPYHTHTSAQTGIYDSSADIVTRLRNKRKKYRGAISGGSRGFSFSKTFTPAVKRPGREVDHSPPSSAEVKKELSYNTSTLIRLHGRHSNSNRHSNRSYFQLTANRLRGLQLMTRCNCFYSKVVSAVLQFDLHWTS